MKHVEENNIAGENRHRSPSILIPKIDVSIASRRDLTSLSGFSSIDIEAEDRLPATAFPKVKREQAKPAPNIQNRPSDPRKSP